MVFHWSLSDSKSPQVSRTLLSILAVLNNAVVWMASTRPPTSKSSSPFSIPLVTTPNAPNAISVIVACMFRSFFQFPSKVEVLILLFTFFQFYSVVSRDSKVDNFASSLFLLIIIKSGLLAEIRWSVCMPKSPRGLCVSFSRTGTGLCIYHLFVWSNLYFLHISRWITLPTQSCLVFYSFCANLLHSLIMWLMVSSLPPHSLHLLFCWLVPFLSHGQVLSCEILFISRLKPPTELFSFTFLLVSAIMLSIVLSVSFLVTIMSPPACFCKLSSSRCIDASTLSSMQVSPLPPPFSWNI